MFRRSTARCAAILVLLGLTGPVRAQFDLEIIPPSTGFNATQQAVLTASLTKAEALWERVITGYQPGILIPKVTVTVMSGSSFADALVTGFSNQNGFWLSTSGRLRINPGVIDAFASWNGVPGPPDPNVGFLGLNYVDDVLAHEIGHILGIGTQWIANGV